MTVEITNYSRMERIEDYFYFFKYVDILWGPYLKRKLLNYDDNTLIDCSDEIIDLVYKLKEDTKNEYFGLGIKIDEKVDFTKGKVNDTYYLDVSFSILKKSEIDNILTENVNLDTTGYYYILPKKFIVESMNSFSSKRLYRLGKNESGKFYIYLHEQDSESHNPIRIPGGQ